MKRRFHQTDQLINKSKEYNPELNPAIVCRYWWSGRSMQEVSSLGTRMAWPPAIRNRLRIDAGNH
ncbi:hypothetical protein EMEDMD4_500054 [Sinorhizobium medicae]|uniref:Uncharacterized protein n=1 Tax=Sinorhizobium medicae TaxID=110321 RepID=A0A508X105_9HYPH|nr:hypothetical protein EMEDMD4_500054 [Sinorhizobium medicae]